MAINRKYRSNSLKKAGEDVKKHSVDKSVTSPDKDSMEDFIALRKLAEERESYENRQQKMERWSEEQYEEENFILQLIHTAENENVLDVREEMYLAEIRDSLGYNTKVREDMKEEMRTTYQKKVLAWDEAEDELRKKIQREQDGRN